MAKPLPDTTLTTSPRQLVKWCAYALALAAPGSFVVLPLWLLRRHWMSRQAWQSIQPRAARLLRPARPR